MSSVSTSSPSPPASPNLFPFAHLSSPSLSPCLSPVLSGRRVLSTLNSIKLPHFTTHEKQVVVLRHYRMKISGKELREIWDRIFEMGIQYTTKQAFVEYVKERRQADCLSILGFGMLQIADYQKTDAYKNYPCSSKAERKFRKKNAVVGIGPLDRIGNMPGTLATRGWSAHKVTRRELEPGDLLFVQGITEPYRKITHVGMVENVDIPANTADVVHCSKEAGGLTREKIEEFCSRYFPFENKKEVISNTDDRIPYGERPSSRAESIPGHLRIPGNGSDWESSPYSSDVEDSLDTSSIPVRHRVARPSSRAEARPSHSRYPSNRSDWESSPYPSDVEDAIGSSSISVPHKVARPSSRAEARPSHPRPPSRNSDWDFSADASAEPSDIEDAREFSFFHSYRNGSSYASTVGSDTGSEIEFELSPNFSPLSSQDGTPHQGRSLDASPDFNPASGSVPGHFSLADDTPSAGNQKSELPRSRSTDWSKPPRSPQQLPRGIFLQIPSPSSSRRSSLSSVSGSSGEGSSSLGFGSTRPVVKGSNLFDRAAQGSGDRSKRLLRLPAPPRINTNSAGGGNYFGILQNSGSSRDLSPEVELSSSAPKDHFVPDAAIPSPEPQSP